MPKMTASATLAIGAGASARNCDAGDLLLAVPVGFVNIFGHQIVIPRCPDGREPRPLVTGGHYRC